MNIDPKGKIKYTRLIIEILINLIQTYPGCSSVYVSKVYIPFVHSIDMILALIGFVRLYVIIRLLRFFFRYRMQRIWKLYKNKSMYIFMFKACLANNGIFFLTLMNFLIILVFMFVYKSAYNCYHDEISLMNAMWVIGQTMMGTGYGDFYPMSLSTQLVCIIVSFIGKFFMASLELNLLYSVSFNEEKENKAYNQIKLLDTKEDKSNAYNIYFENYIKYKMMKIKSKCLNTLICNNKMKEEDKKYDITFNLLKMKNKVKIIREKYYLRVLSTLKNEITVGDFIKYVKTIMSADVSILLDKYQSVFFQMYKYNNYFVETISNYHSVVSDVFYLNNKLTNLSLMIFWTGCHFSIEGHSTINKFKIVDKEDFDTKLREFFLIYKDKYLKHKKKRSCSQFHVRNQIKDPDEISMMSGFENFHFFSPIDKNNISYDWNSSDDEEDDDEVEEEFNNDENERILFTEESNRMKDDSVKDSSDSNF